ncbi:MAG: sn-glycerol-3-phosphate ABC transporter ATP-binding protein UgpC [Fibrobacter sp.]|nr:sn-glycerol-3-phosphate ABC transporter ATP-binding protein UgpC [Fibrobacter sp.]
MAQLKLENVCKAYTGKILTVKDVNLQVNDGELMVFVGPSGCGKSTTLRMIAGLEEITSGKLYIGNRVVNSVTPKDRNIAMVFQNYALYPHMTVYDNIAFGLRSQKVPKGEIDKRVMEAAEMLVLTDKLQKKPKHLSGGERQRVAVGRAVVRKPEVFLFDEPLSNLDATLREKMRVQLRQLQLKLKTTVVYVTHDQVEAMTMGDRICVMNKGVIQQVDTPHNLYNKPKNTFVAKFIGSPQANVVDAQLVQDNDKVLVKIENSQFELPKEKADKVKKYVGKSVLCCLRPEMINHVVDQECQVINKIQLEVNVMEDLGHERLVYFPLTGKECVARIGSRGSIEIGKKYTFCFDMERCHIFDKDSGENISL